MARRFADVFGAMGLCKCPKKKVTNLFCFEHRVNVCEHCLVANHQKVYRTLPEPRTNHTLQCLLLIMYMTGLSQALAHLTYVMLNSSLVLYLSINLDKTHNHIFEFERAITRTYSQFYEERQVIL